LQNFLIQQNDMKHKLLKPLLGCLLAMLLLACAKTEEVAAQGKQKAKTVKEMLCREWKMISDFPAPDYLETDTFGITFYNDNTFIFKTDPAWELGVNPMVLKGKWDFLEIPYLSSKQRLYDICPNNVCTTGHYRIVLHATLGTYPKVRYRLLFNSNSGHVAITSLSDKELNIDLLVGNWPPMLKFKPFTK
jgi:hypothetical protein